MAWNDRYTVVFKGHTSNDHASASVSTEIAVTNLTPIPAPEGEAVEGSDGVIHGAKARRWRISVSCWGFRTKTQASTADYQDWADFIALDTVFRQPYKWLSRTYTIGGSAANLGHIPRAASGGADTFWNLATDTPTGVIALPYLIELEGGLEPDMDNDAGFASLEFEIVGRSRI